MVICWYIPIFWVYVYIYISCFPTLVDEDEDEDDDDDGDGDGDGDGGGGGDGDDGGDGDGDGDDDAMTTTTTKNNKNNKDSNSNSNNNEVQDVSAVLQGIQSGPGSLDPGEIIGQWHFAILTSQISWMVRTHTHNHTFIVLKALFMQAYAFSDSNRLDLVAFLRGMKAHWVVLNGAHQRSNLQVQPSRGHFHACNLWGYPQRACRTWETSPAKIWDAHAGIVV